ncbi:MAG TPA: hypothetical protein VGT44_00630, partial [Ktedonobacteraceae bacterium]|nr:hypothetical protein [Ktedonobacteraceae bacterium]
MPVRFESARFLSLLLFGIEERLMQAVWHLGAVALGVLGDVHGGVGGAEQAVRRGAVVRIKGDANACPTAEHITLHGKGRVETALEALRNFFDSGSAPRNRYQGRKLVAAEAREHIAGPELPLHAHGNFLQVEVADVMAVEVIDLLEL